MVSLRRFAFVTSELAHSALARGLLTATGALLAYSGQWLLLGAQPGTDVGRRQLIAAILVIGAALFAAMTSPSGSAGDERDVAETESGRSVSSRRQTAGAVLATLLGVCSTVIFAWRGESRFVVGLWAASLVGLLLSQLPQPTDPDCGTEVPRSEAGRTRSGPHTDVGRGQFQGRRLVYVFELP